LAIWLLANPGMLFAQTVENPLTLDLYRARLSAAYDALATGADLDEVKRSLAEIQAVRGPNGEVVEIEPLLDGSDERTTALSRIHTTLIQLDAVAGDRTQNRLAQLVDLRQRLALDRPTFWQRIWRWIEDFIDTLMPDQLPRGSRTIAWIGSRLLVWTILITGGILLAILLSYWLRNLLGGILWDRILRRTQDPSLPQTSAQARVQAQEFAGSGNYREAMRQLYLAAVLHLDETGLLRFHRDQTNREVLAQVQPGTPVRAHLEPVVETFDHVWYGIREPDRQTFESYRQEIDGLMAQTAGEAQERTRA
jgi:hypothetical protein